MVNLKQLLEDNKFSYITLLNPSVDLNRPMEAVDTAETPNDYLSFSINLSIEQAILVLAFSLYKDLRVSFRYF